MKHKWVLHFIKVYTVKVKKSSDKKYIFLDYNLTPLDMYNGLSQLPKFIVSNQEEESISIQRDKSSYKPAVVTGKMNINTEGEIRKHLLFL